MSRAPYVSFSVRTRGRRPTASDIVDGVIAGKLPAGSRLPPVRVLEAQYGMSKNTAQAAYEELAARGLIESRSREGWFIRSTSASTSTSACTCTIPSLLPPPALPQPRSARISLSTVFVDPELLPREKLADCARSVLKQPGLKPFYDAQGFPALREAIATRLKKRGMEITAANVVVTTGSQQALDIVARTLVEKRLATETPVYPHARMLFRSNGIEMAGLALDPFAGPDLDAWERTIAAFRPSLLYLITSFQNPTGYSYSTSELERILAIANEHGVAILEDDWGSEMLSGSEYRPMLRLLGGENVLYVGSFTKKLWPSMRVGYLVAPESLVPSLVGAKRLSTLGGAHITEAIVAEFLERGYYDGHLESLHAELDARYAACLEALRELMPDDVRWTTPGGGPTLWLEMPRRIDLPALAERLLAKGVSIESADSAFTGERHLNGFRVSYAFSPPSRLREGLEALASEIR